MSTRALSRVAAVLVAALLAVLAAVATATPAHGAARPDLPGLETTAHGVVVSSTLPHCAAETGGPAYPCTWNVGPGVDGNGAGLAYVVRDARNVDSSYDYVWTTDPRGHGWHWSHVDTDCVVRAGHYRCPDGAHGRNDARGPR